MDLEGRGHRDNEGKQGWWHLAEPMNPKTYGFAQFDDDRPVGTWILGRERGSIQHIRSHNNGVHDLTLHDDGTVAASRFTDLSGAVVVSYGWPSGREAARGAISSENPRLRTGEWTWRYPDGQLLARGEYSADLPSWESFRVGRWVIYRSSGRPWLEIDHPARHRGLYNEKAAQVFLHHESEYLEMGAPHAEWSADERFAIESSSAEWPGRNLWVQSSLGLQLVLDVVAAESEAVEIDVWDRITWL